MSRPENPGLKYISAQDSPGAGLERATERTLLVPPVQDNSLLSSEYTDGVSRLLSCPIDITHHVETCAEQTPLNINIMLQFTKRARLPEFLFLVN